MDYIIQGLILAVTMLSSGVDEREAQRHAEAAVKAADKFGFEPELLLAIAYVESSFIPHSVSYKECTDESCTRKGARGTTKPDNAEPPWYCGVMQVGGNVSWHECRRLMVDVEANYMKGAKWLRKWESQWGQKEQHCGQYKEGSEDRLVCALQGYNGGYPLIENNAQKYPTKVLGTREKIKEVVHQDYVLRVLVEQS